LACAHSGFCLIWGRLFYFALLVLHLWKLVFLGLIFKDGKYSKENSFLTMWSVVSFNLKIPLCVCRGSISPISLFECYQCMSNWEIISFLICILEDDSAGGTVEFVDIGPTVKETANSQMDAAVVALSRELQKLRTGRASAGILSWPSVCFSLIIRNSWF